VREIARRIITGPKSDTSVREFYQRCAERGVEASVIRSVDHRKTKANRAIGGGNAASRSATLNELEQIMPLLDEQGKKNLIYDRIASRVGYETVGRYAMQPDTTRPAIEDKMAELENNSLLAGTAVSVLPTELHETHLRIHLPVIQQILTGISTGQVDPMQMLNGLQQLLQHAGQHTDFVSQDPTATGIAGEAREVMNNAGAVVANFQRKLEADQRKAQEAGAAEAPTADDSAQQAQAKAQAEQILFDLKKQKMELDLQIKQAKFQQDTAIRDAKLYSELQK